MKEITREWLNDIIKDAISNFKNWEEVPDKIRLSRCFDIVFEDGYGDDYEDDKYEDENNDCWLEIELVELTGDDRYPEMVHVPCILEKCQMGDPDTDESYLQFLDFVVRIVNEN